HLAHKKLPIHSVFAALETREAEASTILFQVSTSRCRCKVWWLRRRRKSCLLRSAVPLASYAPMLRLSGIAGTRSDNQILQYIAAAKQPSCRGCPRSISSSSSYVASKVT
ncbi:hypothetical protein JMJ77_0010912, partial [Colletotrichum scovillei]